MLPGELSYRERTAEVRCTNVFVLFSTFPCLGQIALTTFKRNEKNRAIYHEIKGQIKKKQSFPWRYQPP